MASARFADVPVRPVGAIGFAVEPLDAVVARVLGLGATRPQPSPDGIPGIAVHFANAYNIALAGSDRSYAALMGRGDLVYTDGMPVVWAGRRLHPDVAARWTRVYGPDVMTGVLARSDAAAAGDSAAGDPAAQGEAAPRHYLLGGSPQTLDLLQARIAERWPHAVVAGADSPPFRAWTAADLAERDACIADSGATLVWVGLGTPKQDVEVRRLADTLPVTALAVGAAFDFLAGTVEQAPPWMQRSGLEWAYRFGKEPKRLAKRYLWGNPAFIAAVGRQGVDQAMSRRRAS